LNRRSGPCCPPLLLLLALPAQAAGLYFADRGVRPLGRAGAFVAGADDLGALWYNPAGLADAGSSLLIDASWLRFTSDFTRRTLVADGSGAQHVVTFDPVSGSAPLLPIPTLAGSRVLGDEGKVTVAVGAMAPYTAITSYPLTVNGQPAASRYSLVSLDGSALLLLGAYAAWKPIPELRLGAGVEVLTGSFKSTVVFGANPKDRLLGAPEDPQYDAFSQLSVGPIFAPSGIVGGIYAPLPWMRVGLALQLPIHVDSPATISVRLPAAPEFDNAAQVGNAASVQFNLPAILRVGVEVSPLDELRVELAYVRELWSAHQSIDITPTDVSLVNVTGFPSPFHVAPISIPRNFRDSNSLRLGGEYRLSLFHCPFTLRGGAAYEQSAIPNAYESPLTVDLDKITASLGASITLYSHLRLDVLVAHVFGQSTTVSPQEAAVPRVNPVSGNPTATEAINGGDYSARSDVFGLGMAYQF
jgi:long-chain fatty acid transport protein